MGGASPWPTCGESELLAKLQTKWTHQLGQQEDKRKYLRWTHAEGSDLGMSSAPSEDAGESQPLNNNSLQNDDDGASQSTQIPEEFSYMDWRYYEADTCCGCCDVQVSTPNDVPLNAGAAVLREQSSQRMSLFPQLGAKVIAIMTVVQGLTNCMSIGTAGCEPPPPVLLS